MPSFDLHDYLASRKTLVDNALEARLPAADEVPRLVHEAMRYASLEGGKRLRPILALAVGEIGGVAPDDLLDAACAIEMLHSASLVLDDLPSMDNATTRRDRPCTHVTYGEATAILATMGLVALSFDLVARNADGLGRPDAAGRLVHELSRGMGTGGIVCGQHIDLRLSGQSPSLEQLEYACEHKASALFLAAIRIPAGLTDLSGPEVAALVEYGTHVGMAFQITDDLLDAGESSEDGDKETFATHLGTDGARERVADLIAQATSALNTFSGRAEPLRALAEHVKTRTV